MGTARNFKTVQKTQIFNKGLGHNLAGRGFAWNAQGLEFDPHHHKINNILTRKKTKANKNKENSITSCYLIKRLERELGI